MLESLLNRFPVVIIVDRCCRVTDGAACPYLCCRTATFYLPFGRHTSSVGAMTAICESIDAWVCRKAKIGGVARPQNGRRPSNRYAVFCPLRLTATNSCGLFYHAMARGRSSSGREESRIPQPGPRNPDLGTPPATRSGSRLWERLRVCIEPFED